MKYIIILSLLLIGCSSQPKEVDCSCWLVLDELKYDEDDRSFWFVEEYEMTHDCGQYDTETCYSTEYNWYAGPYAKHEHAVEAYEICKQIEIECEKKKALDGTYRTN